VIKIKILVLGGTRYFGIHMVRSLLKKGHDVTIATRGLTKDTFGENVTRIKLDRTNSESIAKALNNLKFDVICDNLAYCSNDVKFLLDSVKTDRYIMTSSMSVYNNFHYNMSENEFDPLSHKLLWCSREDFDYDEVKRQAECAVFQKYPNLSSVAVRFPFVIGTDDYTKRLLFYVEHVLNNIPMDINNLDQELGFISSNEAGDFLSWLVEQNFNGAINGGNKGCIPIGKIISYVEKKTDKKAIISPNEESAPYNGVPSYSINTDKASSIGYDFTDLDTWIFSLLDNLIDQVKFSNTI